MSTEAENYATEMKSSPETLFPLPQNEREGDTAKSPPAGRPRMRRPERHQVEMRMLPLDDLLADDHQARLVWQYVSGLDMSALYGLIRAVEGRAGRSPIDPKILMSLWLYATLDGVGSARQLAQLCEDHVAYQWICGGVSVNHHTLSDFRTAHTEFLDRLLTDSVASLMHQNLVTLHRVAQDGMRVRASAGASSFRRRKTLERCRSEARRQVEALREELRLDPGASGKRQEAARRRAAKERTERVRRALEEVSKVASKKKAAEKDKARASTTDPEARVMKMGDGGFRPAYNVQLAADTDSQVITGVDVTDKGSDNDQLSGMLEQHEQRYKRKPDEILVDGGFVKHQTIAAENSPADGTKVYAPVKSKKTDRLGPHDPHPGECEALNEWRHRMGTDEAKEIYKDRASTAECVNAIARNRGLQQFLVRGLRKVRTVMLWFALAHNLMRAVSLRAEVAVTAG